MIKYSVGDVIKIRHKNSDSASCLVLKISKRHNFYEVELLGNGKTFTIVDDGSFYTIETQVKNEQKSSK